MYSTKGLHVREIFQRRRSTGAIATIVVAALVGTGIETLRTSAAHAAVPVATWGAPTTMAASGADVQISTSSDGSRAVAVWVAGGVLQSNAATISGNTATWGSPIQISTSGQTADNPDVAISSTGDQAVVVWQERVTNGQPWIVKTAAGTVSGTTPAWGSTTDLVTGTSSGGAGKNMAHISADGSAATYLWRVTDSVETASAVVTGQSQTVGPVTTFASVDTSNGDPNLSLALSRDGTRAAAIWVTGFNDDNPVSTASTHTATATITGSTSTWSGASTISTTAAGETYPDIEMSDDGSTIAAAWKQFGSDDQLEVPVSASASWNGSVNWGSVTQLTGNNIEIDVVTLGLSADGKTALVIYEDQVTVGSDGSVASRSATVAGSTQTFGPEEAPTGTYNIDEMDTALSADGLVGIAVWEGNSILRDSINSAPVSVNGSTHTWGTPEQITAGSNEGVYPEVGLSRGGCKASTIWSSDSSFPAVSRSATLTCASPSATSVSPNSGPTRGGTKITITGSGFYPGAKVTVGGKACTNVVVVSPTKITCTTPSGPAGTTDVVVTNDDGQSTSLSKAFKYIPTTTLKVTAAAKTKRIPAGKRTVVVKNVKSNGKKTVKVVCKVNGKTVRGALGKQVCGVSINSAKTKVALTPKCSVSATVVITAKKKGYYANDWRQTWTSRAPRGDLAWLPKACLS